MTVMYPRLLDQNMNLIRRIEPVSGSLDLNLDPLSGAELELKPGDSIPERSWVAMYTEHGLAGIFRSKPQRDRYGERSTSVSLVHGATELNDFLTGKSDQAQAAANTVISTIFSAYHGTHWVLGTVSPTASVVYSLNNSGVLDALVDIMEQLPGYMISFDQSVHPWRLNVIQRPSEVTAQGRLSRNIQSVEISRDDSSLCTRVYYGDGSSYVQDDAAVAKYGVIEHRISDSSLTTAQLQTMANLYLDSHKAPKLSVTISAIDLSRITGEPLDQITLGSRYRLAIPDAETEENQVIEQIVCAVRYNDLFGDPNPQITLASDPETIVTFLKRQRRSGGAARQIAEEEAEKQYQHWVTENDQYKRSVFKIMGVMYDRDGNVIYQVDPETGEIMYDEAGNPIPVYWPESGGSIAGHVTQSAQSLQTLYEKTGVNNLGTLETLYSKITQTADAITTEVTRATGAETTLSSLIQQEAGKIGLFVELKNGQYVIKRAGIISAINEDSTSTTTIKADKIDLQGYVTADEIFANDATIGKYLKADNLIVTTKIKTADLEATNGATIESGLEVSDGAVIGGGLIADSISLGNKTSNTPLGDAIKEITLTGPDTNDMYTLSAETLSGASITIGNFSRAASQGGTTLNGVWGGSTYTVTDSSYGETWTINFDPNTASDATWATELGTGTVNANNSQWLDFPLYIGSHNPSGQMVRSVTVNKSINAGAVYQEGQKSVTPSLNVDGWTWVTQQGEPVSIANGVAAWNPNDQTKIVSQAVSLPSLSISLTKNYAAVSATDKNSVSATVATSNHTIGLAEIATIPPGQTAQTLDAGKNYVLNYTKGNTATGWGYYTIPSAPAPADPKVSKGTWSNGQITFTAGTTGKSSDTVKLVSGNYTGTLDNQLNPTKITFDILEDTGNNATSDTTADVVASIARTAATLSLGTYDSTNSKFTVSKASGGSVSVSSQVIQVGVTPLDIPVTIGSNVIGTPSYQGDGVYSLSATGTITVGGQNLTVSGSDTFTATDAVASGIRQAAENLTISLATHTEYNQSPLSPTSIQSNGCYFVKIGNTAYKKFQAPASGGSDRWARYTEDITLTADDIGESTWMKFATYNTGEPETDASKKTSITVDASAVYARGVDDGAGGTIDVVKEGWTRNTCLFSPSGGSGESASVTINVRGTVKSDSEATTRCSIGAYDGDQYIANSSDILTLARGTSTYNNYIYLCRGYQFSSASILAKIAYNGEPGSESRVVTFLSPIKLTASDISTSTQLTNATFDENDPQYEIPISIDASDVYDKGVADGSRLQIEQLRIVDQPLTQNRTYTLYPSAQKNVMAGIQFTVNVPPVYRTAQSLSQTIVLPATHRNGTITGNYVEYDEGPDTGNFPVVIDARNVYQAGVSAGSGYNVMGNKSYGTVRASGSFTITPDDGFDAMTSATFYVDVPRVVDSVSETVYPGTTTIYPTGQYGAMKKAVVTVPTVDMVTQRDQSVSGGTTMNLTPGHNIRIQLKVGNTVYKTIYVLGKAS